MPRILIVDDHEIARTGLRTMLAAGLPGAEFGEAASTAEALAGLEHGGWDLMLLDLNLPGRDGLDLLAELQASLFRTKVLVVSSYGEDEFAVRCLRLGADGFVAKTSGAREVQAAVRKVLGGGKYVTPRVAERLADALGAGAEGPPEEALTVRELQVLRLIARGLGPRRIAAELQLGERTVSTYRARLAQKLGLESNVELARYALQHRLAD